MPDWMRKLLRAPDDEGAGAGGGDADAAGAAAAGAPQPKWFEDARFESNRDWMTAKGLMAVEDPVAALDKTITGHRNAEKALGKPADSLMEKPKADQPLAEWMRSQAALFGLPESADKYAIDKPTLPDGVKWDDAFESKARQIAFEHGIPTAALNAFVGAYGERVAGLFADADTQLQAANTAMMAELESAWGAQTGAKVQMARQALSAIAEKAKLSPEASADLAQALRPKVGDAGIMKLFATIGEMMGEDSLAGHQAATGGMAMTPAEARQQLAQMDSPDGEYGRAYGKNDRVTLKALEPKRQALLKIASGG